MIWYKKVHTHADSNRPHKHIWDDMFNCMYESIGEEKWTAFLYYVRLLSQQRSDCLRLFDQGPNLYYPGLVGIGVVL